MTNTPKAPKQPTAPEGDWHGAAMSYMVEAAELRDELAGTQAILANALAATDRGNVMTPPWVLDELRKAPRDALDAAEAAAAAYALREAAGEPDKDLIEPDDQAPVTGAFAPAVPGPRPAALSADALARVIFNAAPPSNPHGPDSDLVYGEPYTRHESKRALKIATAILESDLWKAHSLQG